MAQVGAASGVTCAPTRIPRTGGSCLAGKDVASRWLAELAPSCVVDVGAGQGVWRGLLADAAPNARAIAVEVHWPSVQRYELQDRYDHVLVADARWLDWAKVMRTFRPDTVIAGDVLEHMAVADAVTLVDRWRMHQMPVLVSVPIVEWPQGCVDGNPFEEHLHHWSDRQFRDLFAPARAAVDGPMGVYLVVP